MYRLVAGLANGRVGQLWLADEHSLVPRHQTTANSLFYVGGQPPSLSDPVDFVWGKTGQLNSGRSLTFYPWY